MELFPMCARSCAVSVPLLDHVGKLLSLGRDKCDCALTFQTKPLQSLLAHALRNFELLLVDFLRFEHVRDFGRNAAARLVTFMNAHHARSGQMLLARTTTAKCLPDQSLGAD